MEPQRRTRMQLGDGGPPVRLCGWRRHRAASSDRRLTLFTILGPLILAQQAARCRSPARRRSLNQTGASVCSYAFPALRPCSWPSSCIARSRRDGGPTLFCAAVGRSSPTAGAHSHWSGRPARASRSRLALTLVAGVMPAAIAWVGALIVDAVVQAAELRRARRRTRPGARAVAGRPRGACAWPASPASQRGLSLAQSLLRAQLGQRVNVMILDKALTLDLAQFEDSEFYDKLDARAARGLEPPAEPRHPHLRRCCRTASRWSPSAAC